MNKDKQNDAPLPAKAFSPFANDSQQFSCGSDADGELTVENGKKEIRIAGDLTIVKSAASQRNLDALIENLQSIRNSLVSELAKKGPKP